MQNNIEMKRMADKLLYNMGLLDMLRQYGQPHIIGSYRMDMMVGNDLDIDIVNTGMSLQKLHQLTAYILETFKPCWYEAKEEQDDTGNTVWFHGFETTLLGELWNVDLWFQDETAIEKAKAYNDNIVAKCHSDPRLKDAIIQLKKGLMARGLYTFGKYTSTDVYDTVLDKGPLSTDEFLAIRKKMREDTQTYEHPHQRREGAAQQPRL